MTRPELDIDLYSDEAIADPYPLYRRIRDLAPAVWLPAQEVWAIGRYEDLRAALRADTVLVSGQGVALNDMVNGQGTRITLTSDGDEHRRLRTVLMKPMMPSALREVQDEIRALAERLVERLLAMPSFDGIGEFAQFLPLAVVARLVGLPEEGRERMRDWAAATFDLLGPLNDRASAALPQLMEMMAFAGSVERQRLRPGSWGARLFEAADQGRISREEALKLLIDYIAPSLDTTILASGHLLWQLGVHPEQWDLLRGDPELLPKAVDEAIRLEPPVRGFSRVAVEDYRVGDTTIRAGERVLLLYASANRDERRYADPDRFDITRDARDHVGFGHGVHRCAGGSLAELEMQSLLRAMLPRVARIEVEAPEIAPNNVLRGFRRFRARFFTAG